jgi:hypothetical protein
MPAGLGRVKMETRLIRYRGSEPVVRALIQMLEEEDVTVVRRGQRPIEHRDLGTMVEAVIATLEATGTIEGIKAGVAKFRERFPRGGLEIEGEDDDPDT